MRQNPDVCGLVTDTLSIDTSVINAQFTELLDQLRAAIEQAASGQIADGTITTPKYANKSVTAEKLADSSDEKAAEQLAESPAIKAELL